MKNILIYFLSVLAAIFFTLIIFIISAAEPLPEGASEIIEEVLASEIPNQIRGDTGRVASNGVEIWYESMNPQGESKGTILLVMGLGGNAIEWPQYFTTPLVDAGYRVIRFDNRGTGYSTWGDDEISMDDMTDDALAVMDGLGVEAAHIVGMSMGGMIAQVMAINYPDRVLTLTSLMSSGYTDDPELPSMSPSDALAFISTTIRYGIIRTERNVLKTTIGVRKANAVNLSERRMKVLAEQSLFNQRNNRGFNLTAFISQYRAIGNATSRYDRLQNSEVPTLVIHGNLDPLIPVEHGIKTADVIPNADLILIDGMGHDVGPEFMGQIHKGILELVSNNN